MQSKIIDQSAECNSEKKVALLGDSILDNASYVSSGMAVIDHVNGLDRKGWSAELLAVDGAITKDVSSQCRNIRKDTTHLVVSAGGNDALGYLSVFEENVSSVYEGMQFLEEIKNNFHISYKTMLEDLVSLNKSVVICSIYNSFPKVDTPLLAALSLFNDVIFHEAFLYGFPVLDFRHTFINPRDYSSESPIEPSEVGGGKIAHALKGLIESHDFSIAKSSVYH